MSALAIFPPGLDGTLVVPVLVGVIAMFAMTEWLGWPFVGLVVPGYMASLLVVEPVVATVVLLEALATHAAVRALDIAGDRSGLTFPVFGRDRFYLYLATGVIVRIVFEGFLLQWAWTLMDGRFDGASAWRSELFSIGTVLVPLTANRFHKAGVVSGVTQLGAVTALVVAVMSILARWTNFSIAGFDLAYDQLALSFFASPRVQISILITAAIASHFNQRFGWDYHGILVPALLALLVFAPVKGAATIVEAFVIWQVAQAIASAAMFRNLNLEGPRKLVLCFLVGVTLRVVSATVLSEAWPSFRPNDLFGLGYLLPSLIAERIWVKRNVGLVVLPTLQTALLGGSVTLCLGLAISAVDGERSAGSAPSMVSVASASDGAPVAADDQPLLVHLAAPPTTLAPGLTVTEEPPSIGSPEAVTSWLMAHGGVASNTSDGWRLVNVPGRLVVAWPREPSGLLVATLDSREVQSKYAAWRVARQLKAVLVVATGARSQLLDAALAAIGKASTHGLIIRGAAEQLPMGGSLYARPVTVRRAEWLEDAIAPLEAWGKLTDRPAAEGHDPSTLPAGLPLESAAIWLSRDARHQLAAVTDWPNASWIAVAESRGVPKTKLDTAKWLGDGIGVVPAHEKADAVAFVEGHDVSLLPRSSDEKWRLALDPDRGLLALLVEVRAARAVVIAGEGRSHCESAADTKGLDDLLMRPLRCVERP